MTGAADARETIFAVLRRVEAGQAYSTALLHHTLARTRHTPADRAFITEVVLGTLRQRGRLDHALNAVLPRGLAALPVAIQVILRLGLYQLWFLDRVPDAAAVDTSVELARRHGHRGTAGLVNAVLRRLAAAGEPPPPDPAADPAGHLAVVHSHPRWLVERWLRRWGWEETARLCAANNTPPPSTLRVNRLRATPDEVAERLRARGMTVAPGIVPEALRVRGPLDERLDLYRDGLVTMQDEGSMVVARAVDPRPGETVLDAAAAPGGKATHLAELMENRGRVIACDVQPGRLRLVAQQVARLGLDIVEAHHLDAREAGRRFAGAADRVLLDAPCTGTGVVRRRPEIRWRLRPSAPREMAARQAALLAGVRGAVRPGGRLVYAVCSLEPEEGPEVVEGFVRRYPAFRVEETRTLLPHRDDTDGFYLAVLERTGRAA